MRVNYRNKQILKMGHWGTLSQRDCALYEKNPKLQSEVYWHIPAGRSPLLPLCLYFCCLEVNVVIFGQENSRQR